MLNQVSSKTPHPLAANGFQGISGTPEGGPSRKETKEKQLGLCGQNPNQGTRKPGNPGLRFPRATTLNKTLLEVAIPQRPGARRPQANGGGRRRQAKWCEGNKERQHEDRHEEKEEDKGKEQEDEETIPQPNQQQKRQSRPGATQWVH